MNRYLSKGLRILAAAAFLLPVQLPATAKADTLPSLIISEVKVRNDTLGLDEYIEVYNLGAESVNLNDYFLGYFNSPAPPADQEFNEAVIGDGLLGAGESLILAKNELDPNLPDSRHSPFSNLSDSGGTLRITDVLDVVIDQISWTSTQNLAIAPTQYLPGNTASKSQSFTRDSDLDGQYVLANPTWQLTAPSPQSSVLLPVPVPDPEPEPDTEPIPDPELDDNLAPDPAPAPDPQPETVPPTPLLPVQITELLPNPLPPFTDSLDEFVELYNPNDQPVSLAGYKVQTGNTYSYSFEFSEASLPAHGYLTITSGNSALALANSGGKARLLDPNGVVISETSPYAEADEGQAWALISSSWQWTTSPTPGAENVLTSPVPVVPIVKKSVSKASTKKTAVPKVKTASTTKKSTAKASTVSQDDATEPPEIAPLHEGVLAGVGLITLVYAAYEYRHDIANRFFQLKRFREARRTARQAASGQ